MPITFITFLIGSLSLAGFFPLAGFWSKDEILDVSWDHEKYLFYIALLTAGLTAFYMARVIFMTFFGEYKGGEPAEATTAADHDEHGHEDIHGHAASDHASHGLHESPLVMALPLLILAVPAILAGFANINKDVEDLLLGALPKGVEVSEAHFQWSIAIVATLLPLGGVLLAYVIYQAKLVSSASLQRLFGPLHTLLENKYYLDVLYERVIVKTLFYGVIGNAAETFDRVVIDGVVNGAGKSVRQTGNVLRYVQTGQFQAYGAIAFAGLMVMAVVALILGPL